MVDGTPATGRDLHVDVPLSTVVANRRPEGFIADRLLPVTPVSKRSDMYYKFKHGYNARYHGDNFTRRAERTAPKRVHMDVSSDTYYADNYALATDMSVEDEVNADEVLRWSESNAEMLMDNLMIDYEMRVAALCVDTSNVGTVSPVDTVWDNVTGSRPLDDFHNHVEMFRQITGGMRPNIAIIPEQVMTYLRRNDQLRDILYGDRGGLVDETQIARLIGVNEVLVPTVMVNTFDDLDIAGDSFSYADIWSNNMWLARVQTLSGMQTDTWLNAFRWTSPLLGVPMAVERLPFDREKKVLAMQVGYYQDEKVVSDDLAIRISGVIS